MKFIYKIKNYLLKYLNSAAGKAALKGLVKKLILRFFKSAKFGGIKGWLLGVFVKEILIERALEPGIEKIFRKINYKLNVINGEIQIKRLDNADNQDDYNSTVDDIMS